MKMKQGMKIKQGMKRKLALLLSGVLLMQTVFTGPVGAESSESYESHTIKGTPNAAFTSGTQVSIGGKVGGDNTFNFSVDGGLVDEYLEATYSAFLDADGYDESDWDADHLGYSSYDEYLNDQKDSVLPAMHFTVKFHFQEGALDIGSLMAGNIAIDKTREVIGRYELTAGTSGKDAVFKAYFDKKLYYRTEVVFGKSIAASLKEVYKPGDDIGIEAGSSDNDFKITMPNPVTTEPEDGDLVISKTGSSNNKDLTVTYVITAEIRGNDIKFKAPSSGLGATSSEASGGETKKKKKPEKAASSSDSEENDTFDPEDDEDWDDVGDGSFMGPGINLSDIIDKLVPEQKFETKK